MVRALTYTAVQCANEVDIANLGGAIDAIRIGQPIDKAIKTLGLSPDAERMILGFVNSNPQIFGGVLGHSITGGE